MLVSSVFTRSFTPSTRPINVNCVTYVRITLRTYVQKINCDARLRKVRKNKSTRIGYVSICLYVSDIAGKIGECHKCAEIHHTLVHGGDNETTKQSGNCSMEPKF